MGANICLNNVCVGVTYQWDSADCMVETRVRD